jgi:hypothetical protein
MWILKLVGLKPILAVVGVLAAILISFGMIQYGKSIALKDLTIKQQQDYIDTSKRIDNAVRKIPPSTIPNADREWLRKRQASQTK